MGFSRKYIYITTPDADSITDDDWKYFYYPDHLLFINQEFIDYIRIKYGLVVLYKKQQNRVLKILFRRS